MNDLKASFFLLIVSPGKTWQKMDKVPYATQIFLNQFLYPLMGITAIVSFLGHFFLTMLLYQEPCSWQSWNL